MIVDGGDGTASGAAGNGGLGVGTKESSPSDGCCGAETKKSCLGDDRCGVGTEKSCPGEGRCCSSGVVGGLELSPELLSCDTGWLGLSPMSDCVVCNDEPGDVVDSVLFGLLDAHSK